MDPDYGQRPVTVKDGCTVPPYGTGNDIQQVLRERLTQAVLEDDPISIEALAADIGKSVRSLQRYLQSNGTRFTSLLTETRMEYASCLLADTDISISEIAVKLRFANCASFSRSFKKYSGHSPRQARYRSRQKK